MPSSSARLQCEPGMPRPSVVVTGEDVARVESPTGTGKSLSLICSTLSWLQMDQLRASKDASESLYERLKVEMPEGELSEVRTKVADGTQSRNGSSEAKSSVRSLRLPFSTLSPYARPAAPAED
jgi:hypothetical protein